MGNTEYKDRILHELDSLNREQQRKMLDYLLRIKVSEPKGTSGKELLAFAGSIGKEDLDVMEIAIAEGCEKVDANGW